MRNLYLSILIFFLFIHFNSNGQENGYSNQYNLNFNNFNDSIDTWILYLNQSFIKIDSSVVYKNKHPLKFYPIGDQSAFNCSFFQRILLPEVQFDMIEVRLTSKAKNVDKARLLIDHISSEEKIFTTDTFNINHKDTLWNTISYKLPALNMKFIGFRFLMNSEDQKERAYWIDKLNILLNDKPIDTFPVPVVPPFSVQEPEKIKKLSLNEDLYGSIPELNTKKIVALGETVHGSASVNLITAQIIKHQILKNNCKLVLLEFPFESMIFLNKEMQGKTIFKGDSILKSLKPLFDYPVLEDLIAWISCYNKKNQDNPVTLMGIDINLEENENLKLLSCYIKGLNYTLKNKLLDDFCEILLKDFAGVFPVTCSSSALTYLEEHPEIKKIVNSLDYSLIEQSLKMSQKATPFLPIRIDYRDIIMKENTSFLINLFAPKDKRVIIWAHFNHANYAITNPSLPVSSFGSFMKDLYGDQYRCLGVLVGNGGVLSNTIKEGMVPKTILSPQKNSMEYYFNTLPDPFFYCSASLFNDSISYIRTIGQPYFDKKQFMLINPKARMEGIIFIKNSNPAIMTQ